MSIERVIYGSFPCGVDSTSAGLQRYSYTSGYLNSINNDDEARRYLEISYEAPDLFNIYNGFDQSADPDTVSEGIQQYFPRSFSFMTKEIDGKKKGFFCFGKTMGYDWTGARKNAPYNYGLICDIEDIKREPVLYCKSPLVCCDIPRSGFFSDQAPVPRKLQDINDLDATDGCVDLPYEAGFEAIEADDIAEFVSTDDNADILLMMLTALLDYKSGKSDKRIVIADSNRNNLMWIAAITYVFTLAGSVNISFSSYVNDISKSKFDITGVFLPELNGLEREDPYITKFDRHDPDVERNFLIFDFNERSFPDIEVDDHLFFEMVTCAYTIDPELLSDYENFIETSTSYRIADWDYAYGYSLYSLLVKNNTLTGGQLRQAVDFAAKYANADCKQRLGNYFLEKYNSFLGDGETEAFITDYLKSVISTNASASEQIRKKITSDWLDLFFSDEGNANERFYITGNFLQALYGFSDDALCGFLWDSGRNKLSALCGRNDWKNAYIFKTLITLTGIDKINIRDNEVKSMLANVCAGLYGPDNGTYMAKALNTVQAYIQDKIRLILFLDVMCCTMRQLGNENCTNAILDMIAKEYHSTNSQKREELDRELSVMALAPVYYSHILRNVPEQFSLSVRISMFNHICNITRISAEDAVYIINALRQEAIVENQIANVDINNCGRLFSTIVNLSNKCGYPVDRGTLLGIADRCYVEMTGRADFEFTPEELNTVKMVFDNADPNREECYHISLDVYTVLSYLKGLTQAGSPIAYTAGLRIPDYSLMPQDLRNVYNLEVGRICTANWLTTGRFPGFFSYANASNPSDKQEEFDGIMLSILDTLAGYNDARIFRNIADLIECSIVYRKSGYIRNFESVSYGILREKVKKNDILKVLKKDLDIYSNTNPKKVPEIPNEFIQQILPQELEEWIVRIDDLYMGENKGLGNMFTGFKTLFKKDNGNE